MKILPPNLRYIDSCIDCCYSTRKAHDACWCHRYQMLVGDVTICDDFDKYRPKAILKLVKKEN